MAMPLLANRWLNSTFPSPCTSSARRMVECARFSKQIDCVRNGFAHATLKPGKAMSELAEFDVTKCVEPEVYTFFQCAKIAMRRTPAAVAIGERLGEGNCKKLCMRVILFFTVPEGELYSLAEASIHEIDRSSFEPISREDVKEVTICHIFSEIEGTVFHSIAPKVQP
jgi:hypothetical protein